MRLRISVASTVVFIGFMLAGTAAAQPQADTKESYALSAVIRSLTIESWRQSIGDGDNWPITWADDGDLYDYKDHVIVTTEATRGSLRQIVNDEGSRSLAVPPRRRRAFLGPDRGRSVSGGGGRYRCRDRGG